MDDAPKKLKSNIRSTVIVLFVMLTIVGTWFCSTALGSAAADVNDPNGPKVTVTAPTSPEVMKYGLIAAAVAFGLGAIGAGFAISHVGAAAMGAVAEKPEIAGQALIFVALAEGIVVFGFITALMILGKV